MATFNFTSEQYEHYVLAQANKFLDKCGVYGTADEREGLADDVQMSINAKARLLKIFKQSPAYNGKGQLVLPMDVERPVDEDIIGNYADYITAIGRKYMLEGKDVTVNGYTYKQAVEKKRQLDRYIAAIDYMHVRDEDVIIKGKPFAEYRAEYNAVDEVCDKIYYNRTTFKHISGNLYVTKEDYELYEKVNVIANAIRRTVGKHLEDADVIESLINTFPHCQAREGIKITRVVQKCLKELGLYQLATENEQETFNKRYSQYCDAVSPIKVRKWSVLSVNFVDFLSMSCGKDWTSCLSTDKRARFTEGMYSDGFNSRRTLDYALDYTTMVFYTVDEDYNGDDWELQPKGTRQLFHFGEGKLVQGRLYPQDDISRRELYTQFRENVEKLLADAMGEANLWSSPVRGTIDSDGYIVNTPYDYSSNGDFIDFLDCACHGSDERDFQSEVNYVVFRGSSNREDNGRPMIVGSTDAVCIMCGDNMYEDYHEAIACDDCYGRF